MGDPQGLAARRDRVPTDLGRYTVLGKLASGGMATVYVGRHVGVAGFERVVAIKCCHDHLRKNEAFVTMFLNEARLAARIRHPNVVATLDVSDGDPLYLIMEYVEGESLSALARRASARGGRLPLDVILRVITDVLSGLEAAHECTGSDGQPLGLVHCDVSPQNVLVGLDGLARITDFGIARAATQMADEERGVIKGKLSYAAPEQLSGGFVTQRADIFSAGVVLWELLAGRTLFCGETDAATVRAVLSRPVPRPSGLDPSIPKEVDDVVLRALERYPAARFPSASAFLQALEGLSAATATARGVSEYVRSEVGAGALASEWHSGSFRKGAAPQRDASLARGSGFPEPKDEALPPAAQDVETRIFEPPPDLVAAMQGEEPPTAKASVLPEAGYGRPSDAVLAEVAWATAAPFQTAPAPPAPLEHRATAVTDVVPALPIEPRIGAVVEREAMLPDAYRMRRMIVAVVLILLGCAASVLLASSPAPRPAPRPAGSVASPPPAPAAQP